MIKVCIFFIFFFCLCLLYGILKCLFSSFCNFLLAKFSFENNFRSQVMQNEMSSLAKSFFVYFIFVCLRCSGSYIPPRLLHFQLQLMVGGVCCLLSLVKYLDSLFKVD